MIGSKLDQETQAQTEISGKGQWIFKKLGMGGSIKWSLVSHSIWQAVAIYQRRKVKNCPASAVGVCGGCAQLLSHVWLFKTPCSPPGSSVHGISQARILQYNNTVSYSRRSSWLRDQTHISCISCISCIGGWILYHCTWEAPLQGTLG